METDMEDITWSCHGQVPHLASFPTTTSGCTLVFSACSLTPGIQTPSTAPQQWCALLLPAGVDIQAGEDLLGVFTVSSWNSMCLHSRCSQPTELITTPLQAAPNRAVQGQRRLNQILSYSLRHCLLTIRAEEIRISRLFILSLCTSVWKRRRIIPTLVTVVLKEQRSCLSRSMCSIETCGMNDSLSIRDWLNKYDLSIPWDTMKPLNRMELSVNSSGWKYSAAN